MYKIGNGSLREWFDKATDEELVFLSLMSTGALQRLCMLLSLEDQIKKEKSLAK